MEKQSGSKNSSPTIRDVARALNVSPTTVSRVLSGKGRISEETAARVREYIRQSNYVPNAIAQSLADQRTCNLGYILPGVEAMTSQSFFQDCLTGICRALAQTPYDVLMVLEEENGADRLERALVRRKLDGAIVSRALVDDRVCRRLQEAGVPFVLIGSSPDEEIVQVDHDHRTACAALTRRLLANGQRLALLGGSRGLFVTQDRLNGFLDACREAGLDEAGLLVYFDLDSPDRVDAALETALAAGAGCIVCMDDRICGMALSWLHRQGKRIPEEVGIASFYDSFLLESYTPPITTLRFDDRQLGAVACRLLLEQLEGQPAEPPDWIGYEIVFRGSTKG